MSELTADQALFLLQNVYLGSLKNESRITRKVLEAVPADKCQHRPDPVSKNAIELVRHIAVAENRFLQTLITGCSDLNTATIPNTWKRRRGTAPWTRRNFQKISDAPKNLGAGPLARRRASAGLF